MPLALGLALSLAHARSLNEGVGAFTLTLGGQPLTLGGQQLTLGAANG